MRFFRAERLELRSGLLFFFSISAIKKKWRGSDACCRPAGRVFGSGDAASRAKVRPGGCRWKEAWRCEVRFAGAGNRKMDTNNGVLVTSALAKGANFAEPAAGRQRLRAAGGKTDTMKKILLLTLSSVLTLHVMAQEKIVQTAGRDQLGEFAPKFAQLNDDELFGEVWNRSGLGPRERSMITVATLVGKGIVDSSLGHHLQFAKTNGVTRTEISEMLTHIAFYAGWPNAWAAFRLAKEVWAGDSDAGDAKAAFQREMIFPIGEPNTAYAQYFTGNSYLAPVSREQVAIANVTFEPRCRNNWHIHKAAKGGGQMLVGVAGRGWYREEGKPAQAILPGTVIHIPANVKHWHGAAADSWFAHLAFEVAGEACSTEWLEPVTDEAYDRLGGSCCRE